MFCSVRRHGQSFSPPVRATAFDVLTSLEIRVCDGSHTRLSDGLSVGVVSALAGVLESSRLDSCPKFKGSVGQGGCQLSPTGSPNGHDSHMSPVGGVTSPRVSARFFEVLGAANLSTSHWCQEVHRSGW